MENIDIFQRAPQAKIVGTVVAFGGATLMTLYKGIVVISLHTQHSHQTVTTTASQGKNWLKGSFMLVISNISYSSFYILQVIKNQYQGNKNSFLFIYYVRVYCVLPFKGNGRKK
jgi:hypothetical protein